MKVLYLTNNPQLAGTARILVSWITYGAVADIQSAVLVQGRGDLSSWLEANQTAWALNPMTWPDWRRPWTAWPALRAARWARARGVNVIHCNEHDVYPFGSFLRTILRVPIVCHVRFNLKRGFCEWAFGGTRTPDALLWTSEQQRQDCAEAIGGIVPEDRQHLVRLGPDLTKFGSGPVDRVALQRRFDLRPGELVVGSTGALRPIKRIEDFVDLIARLSTKFPNLVGLIAGGAVAGDEAYRDAILQRIQGTGLERRLRWLGHVEPVEPLLRMLDVFVSTSEYETFGNSVAEAMACQLPVVAYTGGSVQEVIGPAGDIVANGDLDGLSAAVERLLGDAERRATLGRLGLERMSTRFSPAASFEKLRQIYHQLGR